MQRVYLWAPVAVAAVLVVGAGHIWVAMSAGGPVAVPDVPAYLGIGQWVGGDGLAPENLPFQPGYGLLIAPLVAIAQVSLLGAQGDVVHHLALILNALAATAAVVAGGRLGLVISRRWWVAGAAAAIAAVHPSLSSASRIAWPETLAGLWVLLIALAVGHAAKHAGDATAWWPWARAGLLAMLAVSLHVRLVALVGAVIATALVCRIGRRSWVGLCGGLLAGGAVSAAAIALTDTWPSARLSEAAQFDRGFEPILTVAGQLLALGGGTFGLALLGLTAGFGIAISTVGSRWRRRPQDGASKASRDSDPLTAVAVFCAVGALGAVLLGGWTLTGSDRADALLYGRYVDPWTVPLAITALCWLATRHSRRQRDSFVLATTAIVALAAGAAVMIAAGDYGAAPRRIMTLSLGPIWSWLDASLESVAATALGVTLIGVILAFAGVRDRRDESHERTAGARLPAPLGGLVLAVLTLGAVATVSNNRYLADVGAVARDQVTAAHTISDAVNDDELACLAHDQASVPDYALWLYRLELPEIAHERVQLDAGGIGCGELVIAHDDLAQRCANARHLVDEPAASWALWHIPQAQCAGR